MTGTPAEIARARSEAAAARERMIVTLGRLRQRIDPRIRARETWEDVRERGEDLGDDAVEFAYERPAVVAAAAGAGVLLVLRRPITRLVRRLFTRRKPKWDTASIPEKSTRHPAGTALPLPGQGGVRR